MNTVRFTCRCPFCMINWPYGQQFVQCPRCGELTKPLKLLANNTDHVLTLTEAKRETEDQPTVDEQIAELYADLDRWADESPAWMGKKKR